MINKNLIILGLLAIGVYAYLNKKKKDQLQPQITQQAQGFFPQTPKKPENSQISNWGLTKEQCEKSGKKYTTVEIQCIKAPCGGDNLSICE